jgi:pilus assembly protein CpaC
MLSSPVKAATQVQLQVRVAEVSRNRLKDVGTSYTYQGSPGSGGWLNSGGGPSSLNNPPASPMSGIISGALSSSALNLLLMGGNSLAMLRTLQTEGSLRELAEPNLIAMDGQEASFLAGGEFPVPIVQGGSDKTTVTILFKEYGVRLNFKPTIIDEDHIRLELEPEVSTIDFANGVKFDGFLIPALKTRRAKTGVELRDGQSFALAGLLDNSEIKSLSKVPVLGDIPIIGSLFRSKSFQKNETELMFIVTAMLVKPVNRDDLPQMRGIDGLKKSSPLGLEPKGEEIQGRTGYSTTGQAAETTPSAAPKTVEPADTKKKTEATESTGAAVSSRSVNQSLPLARSIPANYTYEPVRP